MAAKTFSPMMAVLALAAMFWANCLSCPQMWLERAAQPSHSCCHHPQQPVSASCHTESLQNFIPAGSSAPAPDLHLAVLQPAMAPVVTARPAPAVILTITDESAPPDRLSLLASFRV